MLKQIAISDLEIGMFVHKFEGGWFDHPFWKAKFLVDDDEKLATLKTSRLRAVVIDTSKGRDLNSAPSSGTASHPAAPPAPPADTRIDSIRRRTAAQLAAAQPVSLAQEVETANAIAAKAHERLNRVMIDARLGKALNVRKVEPVVSDILASVRRNPQAFGGLMRCKLKNEQIFRQALSVSALMVALADRMKLSGTEIHNCGLAGLLLDFGVIYLPQIDGADLGDYRNRNEKVWQSHVQLGYRALRDDDKMPEAVLEACLLHHERIDGTGYPQRRSGDDIPVIARMAAICDGFEFLLAGTPGKQGLDPAAAVERMRQQTGAFDEEILRLFIETVGLYPVGAFVELSSRRVGMVIDEDPKHPLQPVVQVFYSLETRERIRPVRIALAGEDNDDRIVGIADVAALGLTDESQLREMVFLSACRNTITA
jgi:HD-GYP domain-containing protein (c-di-GMP phosphodiesterase class II)